MKTRNTIFECKFLLLTFKIQFIKDVFNNSDLYVLNEKAFFKFEVT